MTLWNHHYIRKSEYSLVNGRPNELFFLPKDGYPDQGFQANYNDLDEMIEYVDNQIEEDNIDNLYDEYFLYLTNKLQMNAAKDWETARLNYLRLLNNSRN